MPRLIPASLSISISPSETFSVQPLLNPQKKRSFYLERLLVMHENVHKLPLNGDSKPKSAKPSREPLQWSWEIEHADRKREAKAEGAADGAAAPFPVDRRVLKDVVREHRGVDVGRIVFLSSGTFHKAYLVTMVDHTELVASVARRYMPRLKTESEVATMHYLRENTNIPVPTVYHYDSNPYNRLGGEYILMSKAPGVQLGTVFPSLSYNDLAKLLQNLASMLLPAFAHRFSDIGSLYLGPNPFALLSSSAPTPKAVQLPYSAFPFSPTLSTSNLVASKLNNVKAKLAQPTGREFHVGPIISWPFFGTNRGELTHPTELNRGPWPSSSTYFSSCAQREIESVIRENEGRSAPHRLHLDPDEIHSSRHHRTKAVPGDESDESDEWDPEESDEEFEGPGDIMYRDYRRMQRSTFLVAHLSRREEQVKKEMARWVKLMERLKKATLDDSPESFGLDLHDLSLENIFEKEKEQTLNTTGDLCGGRGGELGRRLEAWLTLNGIEEGRTIAQNWEHDHEAHNEEAHAE
ncbi:hypothetical protein H0H93_016444 [Arthromyces matolae]|nr:hypothetical protein H0H93_016444 [Arthromyces matolae]